MSGQLVLEKKLLTCNEYHAMIAAGILDEEDRLELLEGELIIMSPINPKHSGVVNRADRLLKRLLQDTAIVAVQNPITILYYSEPQPDITVARPRDDFYETAHPRPEDIFFVVEVADASLEKDRKLKSKIFAKAGIPCYWIINLVDRQVEVYSQPSGQQYLNEEIYLPGEELPLPGFDLSVSVEEIIV